MTLTAVATITKRAILASIILLVVGLSSFIGYQIWHANYLASLPKPEEKPDTKFGILPRLEFIPSNVSSSNFSYQISTQTGGLPNFGKLMKVYFIPKATATFLASDKASALAGKFSIDTPPDATAESYTFKKDAKTLNLNINTGNFIYKKEATISGSKFQNTDTQIIQNFKTFLSFLGILKDELKNGTGKVSGQQISIWPSDIDKKPIVTAKYTQGLIQGEASQSAISLEDYTSLSFIFWPVDTTTFSTYPIKSTLQAFDDLKKGQGNIVVEPKSAQVQITSANLGYFESENYTPYLQPVFVFEGPNFVGLVPAITDQYITH